MQKNLFTALFSSCCFFAYSQPAVLSGFKEAEAKQQLATEASFDSYLSAKDIDQSIRDMSARPHHVGSPGGQVVADYIFAKYKSWGFDVRQETFYVLFPTPKMRLLEMTGPEKYMAILKEPALKEDATSGQSSEQLPTYNCYSPDGDVTGVLVFVNYGTPDDYDVLDRLGISVKGKIVIAKYGVCWRGVKPKVAQEHGAIGCIIYSDPKDDGYFQGDVYPKGSFRNEYGVQRGSVMDMPLYPGDPLTPGTGSTKDAQRLDRKDAMNLLKIPVLPISYHDAIPLLRAMEGPIAPAAWRGALPFTYHIGPGKTIVHLKLEFNWDIKPVHDIIAFIHGSERPDEWVIRGNHHDAWVNGAEDPISGQAVLLEEAKAIGELVKSGWKPKRTLVYCSWDGEEEGLLGSTEWSEFHADELQKKGVIYINSDGYGRGFLDAEGSHALEPFINEVAMAVTDPQTGTSVWERKRSNDLVQAATSKDKKDILDKKSFALGPLGSGSDFSPFLQHLGLPSLNMSFSGEDNGGEYHSIYDSYDLFRKFKDPTFEYGVALAKVAGRIALRVADASLLPFDYRSLSKTLHTYAEELIQLSDQMRETTSIENQLIRENRYTYAADPTLKLQSPKIKDPVPFLNFSSLQNALTELDLICKKLAETIAKPSLTDVQRQSLNEKLFTAEQKLLTTTGLPRRGWYRHTVYAPGYYTGYGVKTFPGIREAIEQRNWKEAQEQIEIAGQTMKSFSAYLDPGM